MAYTLNELIDRLSDYRDDLGGDVEVRTMTQQNWPFENSIFGLCSSREMLDCCDEEGDEDDKDDDEEEELVVYIVEGSQLGYGSKKAWEAAN